MVFGSFFLLISRLYTILGISVLSFSWFITYKTNQINEIAGTLLLTLASRIKRAPSILISSIDCFMAATPLYMFYCFLIYPDIHHKPTKVIG